MVCYLYSTRNLVLFCNLLYIILHTGAICYLSRCNRDKYCREPSLRDLRAYSAELSRGESANDILSALANREKEMKLTQQKKDEGTNSSAPRYQSGVLRTNCIDCLDRTNVAQYAYGLAALGRQLHAMGLSDTPKIDPDSSIAAALMDMYQSMGDALAQQYGGSAAHNTVIILFITFDHLLTKQYLQCLFSNVVEWIIGFPRKAGEMEGHDTV